MPAQTAAIYRFGMFEFDSRSAELRKNGVKLKLQDQPSQVLVYLLDRPGKLVNREELRSILWPKDTFVDFETGLNTAVKRLRETLGDSAENPTFIETVPRKGYRFIAPVETPAGQDSKIPSTVEVQKKLRNSSFKRWGAGTAVAALLLSIMALWSRQPRAPTVVNVVRITNDGKAKSPNNLSVTDGVHLYFIEGTPWTTGSRIAQMSARGGETTWIATTLEDILKIHDISPDGSELLLGKWVTVGSDRTAELWAQPLPAGAPHRIGNIIASSACWTPDGMHIVYGDRHAITMTNKDGSEARSLATISGVVNGLRFSPDGRRIRFYVTQTWASSASLWEMNANGRDLHPLFADWKESPYQCCGNWSPDGDYYYFQAGHGEAQAIWVLPERHFFFRRGADGPRRLVSGPLHFSAPLASTDGKRLFVVGEERRVELFRYDPRARRFDPYLPGFSAGPVDFSFDRKWMAYVSYPEMTLWRSRVDGTEKTQLTFPPVRAYLPRWSPEGAKIAFMDVQPNRHWKICMLSSSGGNPELLEQGGTDEAELDPTWTPDGKSIVLGKLDRSGNKGIYRLELETRKLSAVAGSDGLFSPRLSPDGHYISALTGSQTKLMLFDMNSNHWSSLVEAEHIGFNEWSHDGKYVYFRELCKGAEELVRVRIKDGVVETVLSLKDFPQLADVFAAWIGLTPDDEPLLMRDRSVQEIYALDLNFH